ncbi:MAG: N-acyl homoserine lactonase family protein [Sulfolobales archaeon]
MGWFIPDPAVIQERGVSKPATWVDIPVTGALIEHRDGVVLIDTGSHPEAERMWPKASWSVFPMTKFSEENKLENQLKLAGYKPSDIHFVIFTHLHLDHAGQAYVLRDHGVTYVMHERELKHALYMMWLGKTGAYVPTDLEALRGANIHPISDEYIEFLPGIEIYRFGGHTPGSIVIKVSTERGNEYVFTGDFLHLPRELEVESKGWLLGNYEEFLRGVKLLKLWSRRPSVRLVISHDPDLWSKYPKAPKHLE